MSRKILYLGDDSWCYTENCRRHGEATALQSQYLSHVRSGDTAGAAEIETKMLASPESKEAILRLKVQEIRKNLGRSPAIGLDFDGTVADFTGGMRQHLGLKYKVPKEEWLERYPDPDEYEYSAGSSPWFRTREEFLEEFLEAEKQGLYVKLNLIDSPNKTLDRLKGYGFRIIGTTARSDIYNSDTMEWLKHKRINPEQVIHTGPRKSHVKDADVFIEDSPKVLDELFENNRPAVVKTQDYNTKMVLPEHLSSRMGAWDENSTPQEVVDLAFRTHKKR